MLITDARHLLTEKGAHAPLQLAEFVGEVISWATDYDEVGAVKPTCLKCKSDLLINRGLDDAVVWRCLGGSHEGRISSWQGTFWDMEDRPERSD